MKTRYASILAGAALLFTSAVQAQHGPLATARLAQTGSQLRGSGPPNDECTGAVNQALAVGSTITFTGDNTGATDTEAIGLATAWEMFTTTDCAHLTVNYCGTSPVFGNAFLSVLIGCPWTSYTVAGTFEQTTCSDGNYTIVVGDQPAGVYYYAVLTEPGSEGPYTINVTATACAAIGVDEVQATAAAFSVFPNPASGAIDLQYTGTTGLGQVEVMDAMGRVVHSEALYLTMGSTRTLDVAHLSSGNYNVRLTMDGARTEQRLMVL